MCRLVISVVSWIAVARMKCVVCEIAPGITSDALAFRRVTLWAAWCIRLISVRTKAFNKRSIGPSQSESYTSCANADAILQIHRRWYCRNEDL